MKCFDSCFNKLKNNKNLILIFLVTFSIYLLNLPIDYSKSLETKVARRLLNSNDVTAATFIPYEVIKYGTLFFSDDTVSAMRRAQSHDKDLYSVIYKNNHYVSAMPILAGIMAIPFYVLPVLLNKIPSLQYYEDLVKILTLARIAASFYTAVSVVIFYLILKEIDILKSYKTDKWTYVFLALFAFGTNVYSIASRTLWQHTSSLFLVTIVIYLMLKSITDKKYVKYMGLFAALVYVARPLNIIFVFLLTGYVFFKYRDQFIKYILYALPIAFLLFTYNIYSWGQPFTTEYVEKSDTSFSTPLWYGAFGYLVSPSRSFLFITPPLVLSYYAMFLVFTKKKKIDFDLMLIVLSITYILIFIMYSMWHDWAGGDRFGYGFFTEWVPIVSVLTYTIVKPLKKVGKIIFMVLMIWSLYTQFNAVWFRKSRCAGDSHNWTFYCIQPQFLTVQEY